MMAAPTPSGSAPVQVIRRLGIYVEVQGAENLCTGGAQLRREEPSSGFGVRRVPS